MEQTKHEDEESDDKKKKENSVKKLVGAKPTVYVPPVPFLQRLQKAREANQFLKFLEVFKKLHINIPFADALAQMPSYVKFMKEILSKKRNSKTLR